MNSSVTSREAFQRIFFLVNVYFTYVQVVIRRVRWLGPLPYEINVDETYATIIDLLVEELDKNSTTFGNYDVAKS